LPVETISLDGESTSFISLELAERITSVGLLELTGMKTAILGLLELTRRTTLISGTAARLGDCSGGQQFGQQHGYGQRSDGRELPAFLQELTTIVVAGWKLIPRGQGGFAFHGNSCGYGLSRSNITCFRAAAEGPQKTGPSKEVVDSAGPG
jgi:hypothetical protein